MTSPQAMTEIKPQTLPLLLALPLVLALLFVLRLLTLLASAMPLAMTMRIHVGSLRGPVMVMLSCLQLQGHTHEPCKWAISSRVPICLRTIFRGTDNGDICHLHSRLDLVTEVGQYLQNSLPELSFHSRFRLILICNSTSQSRFCALHAAGVSMLWTGMITSRIDCRKLPLATVMSAC